MNRTRRTFGRLLANQKDITRVSRATVRVPAAVPKSRTDVKTKVSEMEIVAGTETSLTVAEPLIRVRAARMSH